ncbi:MULTISPECIES: chaperone modulator CbpM [Mesonia]|uniref:Chaperone modulatory protein CbpM n=1 Tax=Mesonia oceanica TaxID=2687242 RepID=A0AC61Y506_9FLAO|nr:MULTISPECIES: chaperone modulator CbpM [Mesonia]MAN27709.1 MerR family transcriptional regulator [Mesonia sp.]MAQ39689.1 MerR family transcriptional regulator [Mesonia sp.]VVU99549.1 Chaperone modulatory protein CbpM [Mesonia oceanica]|tara:strand:+ start:4001 stop:4291 length:291 start_codon:yes stop_codon:yes gene_type:complete
MKSEDYIEITEICTYYKVEQHFIEQLRDSGFLELVVIQQKDYLPYRFIPKFEKLRRLHYELDINLEGLEAIETLLEKVEELQETNRKLKNRLSLYE